MATPAQHEALYAQLRAHVLARHFAVGRFFRTNLISLVNPLVDPPPGATDNLGSADVEQLRRWSVGRRTRENPLLESGRLLAWLAIEVDLGHEAAAQPLTCALEAVADLFPLTGAAAGWIVRWGPVDSDTWMTAADDSLVASTEFLPDGRGGYLFCVPATDDRRVPLRPTQTLRRLLPQAEADAYEAAHTASFESNLVWETSMDELSGLVGGLAIAHRLAGTRVPAVATAAQGIAARLGDYLADHGYLLIRPCGGFNARGATGVLPAMEWPLARALGGITGRDMSSRIGFDEALAVAGYQRTLQAQIARLVATAEAGSLLLGPLVGTLGSLAPLVGGPLGPLAGTAMASAAALVTPVRVGTAAALFLHRDCFDVSNDAAAREVVVGYLFKTLPARLGHRAWMAAMSQPGGGYARGFAPYLALSALDDADPTVRDAYLTTFRAERARIAPDPGEPGMLDSAFATAMAVVHGATELEPLLVNQLDERYARFSAEMDIPVDGGEQRIFFANDYLGALAVAWLHARRRAAAGTPVAVQGFPVPPTSFGTWPAPRVPRVVLERLPEVRRAFLGTGSLPPGDVDVFSPAVATRRGVAPAPVLPQPGPLVGEFTYAVRESARDVFTGITLEWGDDYEIDAAGQIWAGAALTGANGPAGWVDRLVDDARWPLHSGLDPVHAHPFGLLARVGGWFYVGDRLARRRYLSPRPLGLHLRINDDRPGNGSGQFMVTVRLWGRPRPVVYPERSILCANRDRRNQIASVGGIHSDGTPWTLSRADAVTWVERYGHAFTVGADDGPTVTVVRHRYLRSRGDRSRTNNLASLPRC